MKIDFTEEELKLIETVMDIQMSLCGDRIKKTIDTFFLADEEYKKLLAVDIFEVGRTQLTLKSIRDKLEARP